jgi:hypothetical protein
MVGGGRAEFSRIALDRVSGGEYTLQALARGQSPGTGCLSMGSEDGASDPGPGGGVTVCGGGTLTSWQHGRVETVLVSEGWDLRRCLPKTERATHDICWSLSGGQERA